MKESFLLAATRKNDTKLKKTENIEKENNTNKSEFSENEILDLNSLKSFESESKTNISLILILRVINSSSSDDEEEGIDKVNR